MQGHFDFSDQPAGDGLDRWASTTRAGFAPAGPAARLATGPRGGSLSEKTAWCCAANYSSRKPCSFWITWTSTISNSPWGRWISVPPDIESCVRMD